MSGIGSTIFNTAHHQWAASDSAVFTSLTPKSKLGLTTMKGGSLLCAGS